MQYAGSALHHVGPLLSVHRISICGIWAQCWGLLAAVSPGQDLLGLGGQGRGGAAAGWGHLKKPCWKAERRRVLRMSTSAIWHISMLMKNTVWQVYCWYRRCPNVCGPRGNKSSLSPGGEPLQPAGHTGPGATSPSILYPWCQTPRWGQRELHGLPGLQDPRVQGLET